MKILIAPDSLKGSLSAIDFCRIVAEQIRSVTADADLYLIPMADGGEGTIDAICANNQSKLISTQAHDPLGKPIEAHYAILKEQHTAVIEMAQASGLPLISSDNRNPLLATSYGTGELIIDALKHGCRRFIIGLGGSATNDGGMGMLQALGVKFLDAQLQDIHACGQALGEINTIDISGFSSQFQQSEIIIAGDVTNPLLGKQGATYTFGPQKGADDTMLAELEKGMRLFAHKSLLPETSLPLLDDNMINASGAGAAGGMGFALMTYGQAKMKSGFELIAEMADLDGLFTSPQKRPDLIITGEGCFDRQSLHGKLVGRLGERADKYHIPMVVICGSVGDDLQSSDISSNISAFSICQGPSSLEDTMKNTEVLLQKLMSNLLKILIK